MANEQNLKPIMTTQRARELQQLSVKKRLENIEKEKTFRAMLLIELDKINKKTGKTLREELNDAILAKAADGDTKAYEVVRDTVGEKPTDKQEVLGEQSFNLNIKVIE